MSIERFEDLKSWQEARTLQQIVYALTKREAFREDRGLTWQLQAAIISPMSNIAEAHGRYSFEDKRRFLDIALGSCKEIQCQLYIALDRAHVGQAEFDAAYAQAEAVAQLINGTVDNLDRQIARRQSDNAGPRRRRRHPNPRPQIPLSPSGGEGQGEGREQPNRRPAERI